MNSAGVFPPQTVRTPPRGVFATAALVLASLAVFVALLGASCAIYPGGSWIDRTAIGHSFANNLLCDLVQPIALNGTPNPVGSRLAQAAMLVLIACLGAQWTLISQLLRAQSRLSRCVFSAGICASLAGIAIPLTPSQRFGTLHTLAVLFAALPTLLAGGCAAVGFVRAGRAHRIDAGVGLFAFGLCLIDVLACARQIATSAPITPLFAGLQRAALIGTLVWLVSTSVRAIWSANFPVIRREQQPARTP